MTQPQVTLTCVNNLAMLLQDLGKVPLRGAGTARRETGPEFQVLEESVALKARGNVQQWSLS